MEGPLLQIPPEIRIMVYEYLLAPGGSTRIIIRNKPKHAAARGLDREYRRSAYPILERSLSRRSYEATYCFEGDRLHPAILATSRRVRDEASHYLYAMHTFDFGEDLEAVVPFLSDKTLATRALIQDITLHKRGSIGTIDNDCYAWAAACRFLRTLPKLNKMTVMVGGGQPQHPWDGPKELSVSDLRLLYSTRHELLEWVRELAHVEAAAKVEIAAELRYLPQPTTTTALLFAAFSASIETSLVDFLQADLNMSACALPRPDTGESPIPEGAGL